MSDDYAAGYKIGYENAAYSGKYAVDRGRYVPTAEERARSVDFKGNDQLRAGWLAGWAAAIGPYRSQQ
jgi:hypothetical protein